MWRESRAERDHQLPLAARCTAQLACGPACLAGVPGPGQLPRRNAPAAALVHTRLHSRREAAQEAPKAHRHAGPGAAPSAAAVQRDVVHRRELVMRRAWQVEAQSVHAPSTRAWASHERSGARGSVAKRH
eukprot:353414-Chlamydomonas_euryale.AAC.20